MTSSMVRKERQVLDKNNKKLITQQYWEIEVSDEAISTDGGTPQDILNTEALTNVLKRANKLKPDGRELTHRVHALQALQSLCNVIVKRHARQNPNFGEQEVAKSIAKLYAYGSYRLNVYSAGDDIDVVCVGPRYLDRNTFFNDLSEELQAHNDVKDFYDVRSAYVPILSFEFRGIDIDFGYCSINKLIIPPKFNLNDNNVLRSLDNKSVMSINGTRLADKLLDLVKQNADNDFEKERKSHVFELALRAIRHWAKRRAIYSNKMGYFGGVSWNILTAKVCQLYPNVTAAQLVQKFFLWAHHRTFKGVRNAVLLCNIEKDVNNICPQVSVWDADTEENHQGREMHVHIVTPAFPSMNSTHNCARANQIKLDEEFGRACHLITPKPIVNESDWEELFEETTFFTDHKWYLVIRACSKPQRLKEWAALIESQLRKLVDNITRCGYRAIPYCYGVNVPLTDEERRARIHPNILRKEKQLHDKRKKLKAKQQKEADLQKVLAHIQKLEEQNELQKQQEAKEAKLKNVRDKQLEAKKQLKTLKMAQEVTTTTITTATTATTATATTTTAIMAQENNQREKPVIDNDSSPNMDMPMTMPGLEKDDSLSDIDINDDDDSNVNDNSNNNNSEAQMNGSSVLDVLNTSNISNVSNSSSSGLNISVSSIHASSISNISTSGSNVNTPDGKSQGVNTNTNTTTTTIATTNANTDGNQTVTTIQTNVAVTNNGSIQKSVSLSSSVEIISETIVTAAPQPKKIMAPPALAVGSQSQSSQDSSKSPKLIKAKTKAKSNSVVDLTNDIETSKANSPRMTNMNMNRTNSSGHSSNTKASSPRSSITKPTTPRSTASNNPSTSWINPEYASKLQRTKAAVKKHKPTRGFRGVRGSYGYMGYRGRGGGRGGGGYYGRGGYGGHRNRGGYGRSGYRNNYYGNGYRGGYNRGRYRKFRPYPGYNAGHPRPRNYQRGGHHPHSNNHHHHHNGRTMRGSHTITPSQAPSIVSTPNATQNQTPAGSVEALSLKRGTSGMTNVSNGIGTHEGSVEIPPNGVNVNEMDHTGGGYGNFAVELGIEINIHELGCCENWCEKYLTGPKKNTYKSKAFVIGIDEYNRNSYDISKRYDDNLDFTNTTGYESVWEQIQIWLNGQGLFKKHGPLFDVDMEGNHVLFKIVPCNKLPHWFFPENGGKRYNTEDIRAHRKIMRIRRELWKEVGSLETRDQFERKLMAKYKEELEDEREYREKMQERASSVASNRSNRSNKSNGSKHSKTSAKSKSKNKQKSKSKSNSLTSTNGTGTGAATGTKSSMFGELDRHFTEQDSELSDDDISIHPLKDAREKNRLKNSGDKKAGKTSKSKNKTKSSKGKKSTKSKVATNGKNKVKNQTKLKASNSNSGDDNEDSDISNDSEHEEKDNNMNKNANTTKENNNDNLDMDDGFFDSLSVLGNLDSLPGFGTDDSDTKMKNKEKEKTKEKSKRKGKELKKKKKSKKKDKSKGKTKRAENEDDELEEPPAKKRKLNGSVQSNNNNNKNNGLNGINGMNDNMSIDPYTAEIVGKINEMNDTTVAFTAIQSIDNIASGSGGDTDDGNALKAAAAKIDFDKDGDDSETWHFVKKLARYATNYPRMIPFTPIENTPLGKMKSDIQRSVLHAIRFASDDWRSEFERVLYGKAKYHCQNVQTLPMFQQLLDSQTLSELAHELAWEYLAYKSKEGE